MKYLAFFVLIIFSFFGFSQNNICQQKRNNVSYQTLSSSQRSDTVDVLHYHIDLEIIDFTAKSIAGFCTIEFTPQQPSINTISFDLLSFVIDSIIQNNTSLTYSYNDTLLVVNLDNTYNSTDTSSVTIYYNGQPQQDPSGWGGFYFQNGYAFNLGVGFESVPHNYGRAWFPCFDNFVERSTYSFNIKTAGGKVATCNGFLANETVISGDTISREWILDKEIPTYLACVAVANYATIHQSHNGINGSIPIELYAKSADTNNVKNSFINLGGAIDAFEQAYGPYLWNKVGYSMVPFSSGAMEHATNIAYPKVAANGSLSFETLMAHELSHHWWGNLATCTTAEEMWINEGMARYCEALFLEHQYGRVKYEEDIDANHLFVLRYPQHFEGGYLALNNIPLQHTYGDHVYLKGADVVHTLRGYLGDSLYFSGLTKFLADHKFTDVSSTIMRDSLSAYTGVDLTDFFDGWIMNSGFPEFETRFFEVTANNNEYDIKIGIAQKLKEAPNYFNNVPLEITFMDQNWTKYTSKIVMSGNYMVFNLTIPIHPVYATIDFNNLISDAITDDKFVINSIGSYNAVNGLLDITVENIVDSAFIRVEHMWVAPDPIKDASMKYQLSTSRYYRVDGIIPNGFDATARFFYDGRATTTTNGGWLDNDLVSVTEDSLRLFYRQKTTDEWSEFPYYQKNTLFNATNAYGYIVIDSLLLGEYTLGNDKYDVVISSIEELEEGRNMLIYPNPNNGNFTLELEKELAKTEQLFIYNVSGKLVESISIPANTKMIDLNISLSAGNYICQMRTNNSIKKGKFIIAN